MDTEISAAGSLKERRMWGGNIKVYTRRAKNKKLENISTSDLEFTAKAKGDEKCHKSDRGDNTNNKNINIFSVQSTHTFAIQDEGNNIIADHSLQIEEDNDSISDKFLQNVATEDLNVEKEDENATVHNQPVQIVATEGLNLIHRGENNTLYDESVEIVNSGYSDSDLTTEEKKDDKGDERNNQNIETLPDQSIHTLATQDCNPILDNEIVAEQSLQIETSKDLNLIIEKESDTINDKSLRIATENLKAVQEDECDALHDQSLQIKTNKDSNSDQNDCNDTTHDQFSEVANDTVLDNPLQNVVTVDSDFVQESENVTPLNSGGTNILPAHDHPVQVAVENECKKSNINGSVKPIITQVNGRVRINLAPARPKNEIIGLKRKLEDELDQVRSLVQRLETQKIQLSSYSAGNGVYSGSHRHLHYKVDKIRSLARVNSVAGSVSHDPSPRPFQNPSVEVVENEHDVNNFVEKRTPKENRYYRSSNFLLANDRLPKTNGIKRHGGEVEYGYAMNKYTSQALKSCNNLLAKLTRHKFAWVFNKPVDAKVLGLHDYHYIIRNPMDLGTVKSRLGKDFYTSPREFAEDVRLTFHNAMTYNPKGQDVHVMAEQLLAIFEDKWAAIESEYNYGFRYGVVHDMDLPTPLSRKVQPPPPQSLSRPPALDMRVLERAESTMPTDYYRLKPNTPVGRTPVPKKPKAKDLNKRDMTYDEKQRLSTQLQNLPSDKLDAIIQIIKKGNSSLSQHDDEIEVDIDSVDTETLWELDRLVTNYKKNLSKKKRRAELAQARAQTRPAVLATNHTPAVIHATPKTSKQDRNNVASFPLPEEKLGELCTSSSSSSDSDSDSSDSDSDSSSGYGSDAGHSPKT